MSLLKSMQHLNISEYCCQVQQQHEFVEDNIHGLYKYYGNDHSTQFHQPELNLNDEIHQRLQQLEQFQQCVMQQQMKELKVRSNVNLPMDKCTRNMSAYNKKPIKRSVIQETAAERNSNAEDTSESVNVRDLIFTFEQQSLREPEQIQRNQRELFTDKTQSQRQMNNEARIKGMDFTCSPQFSCCPERLYVPKEISLASYAPPPVQSTHNLPSSPKTVEYEAPPYAGFPVANTKSGLYNSMPPKLQLYNPTSYQKVPSSSQQAGLQVNYSPSPLSYNKLSKFQESADQGNQRYLNVKKQPAYRGVQNVSPTPFLSDGAGGHDNRLPYNVESQQIWRGGNQSFNSCARGWNKETNNIKRNVYCPKTVSIPATENLPYSDF